MEIKINYKILNLVLTKRDRLAAFCYVYFSYVHASEIQVALLLLSSRSLMLQHILVVIFFQFGTTETHLLHRKKKIRYIISEFNLAYIWLVSKFIFDSVVSTVKLLFSTYNHFFYQIILKILNEKYRQIFIFMS